MSPLEKKVQDLERKLEAVQSAQDVAFIEAIARRLVDRGVFLSGTATLADLSDVSGTGSATTGQVLKKTATTWQPGTDNTS